MAGKCCPTPAPEVPGVPEAPLAEAVCHILDSFDAVLRQLEAAATGHMVHAKSCGTLATADWAHEIHPAPNGFKQIAAHCRAPLLRSHALAT